MENIYCYATKSSPYDTFIYNFIQQILGSLKFCFVVFIMIIFSFVVFSLQLFNYVTFLFLGKSSVFLYVNLYLGEELCLS